MKRYKLTGKMYVDESGNIQEVDTGHFETYFHTIERACCQWASGYKHGYVKDCKLFDTHLDDEVDDRITDIFYNMYYRRKVEWDENDHEIKNETLDT